VGFICLIVADRLLLHRFDQKNDSIEDLKRDLVRDPQNTRSLRKLTLLMEEKQRIIPANAASAIGYVARTVGPEKMHTNTVTSLAKALTQGDPFLRRSAALALVEFGAYAQPAIPALTNALREGDTDTAWFSAEALGAIGPGATSAIPALIQAAQFEAVAADGSPSQLRKYAIDALGRIGRVAEDAILTLNKALVDRDIELRIRAAVALTRIDPTNGMGLDVIASILKNGSPNDRRKAIWALEELGSLAALASSLVKGLTNDADQEIRSGAQRILETLDSR
jgi:HEAT repeat protein